MTAGRIQRKFGRSQPAFFSPTSPDGAKRFAKGHAEAGPGSSFVWALAYLLVAFALLLSVVPAGRHLGGVSTPGAPSQDHQAVRGGLPGYATAAPASPLAPLGLASRDPSGPASVTDALAAGSTGDSDAAQQLAEANARYDLEIQAVESGADGELELADAWGGGTFALDLLGSDHGARDNVSRAEPASPPHEFVAKQGLPRGPPRHSV